MAGVVVASDAFSVDGVGVRVGVEVCAMVAILDEVSGFRGG